MAASFHLSPDNGRRTRSPTFTKVDTQLGGNATPIPTGAARSALQNHRTGIQQHSRFPGRRAKNAEPLRDRCHGLVEGDDCEARLRFPAAVMLNIGRACPEYPIEGCQFGCDQRAVGAVPILHHQIKSLRDRVSQSFSQVSSTCKPGYCQPGDAKTGMTYRFPKVRNERYTKVPLTSLSNAPSPRHAAASARSSSRRCTLEEVTARVR